MLRVSFALLCALRVLPTYDQFKTRTGRGEPQLLKGIVDRTWRDIEADRLNRDELEHALDLCMEIMPKEDEGTWDEVQAYAEDACAAVAYALRARLSNDPREAALAARRVYEAIDYFVTSSCKAIPDSSVSDTTMLSHPLVQAELARQQRDLQDLTDLKKTDDPWSRLSELRVRSERDAEAFFQFAV